MLMCLLTTHCSPGRAPIMRRLLVFIVGRIFFFGLRFMEWDPWERLSHDVVPRQFGPGSQHDFRWYFEGESVVRVEGVDDVCEWLVQCEYARDPDLFHERDFWQHPSTFEQLRKGDCEDHALWAWRKLTELGIAAEFYVGRWRSGRNGELGFHAWVICKYDDVDYLLETTASERDAILCRLDEVRGDYIPHFSIDAHFDSTTFGGYLLYLKDQYEKRRLGRPVP